MFVHEHKYSSIELKVAEILLKRTRSSKDQRLYLYFEVWKLKRFHLGTIPLKYRSTICLVIPSVYYIQDMKVILLAFDTYFRVCIFQFFHSYIYIYNILCIYYSKLLWNHKNSVSAKVLLRIHDVNAIVIWFIQLLLFLATTLYIRQKGASNNITEYFNF